MEARPVPGRDVVVGGSGDGDEILLRRGPAAVARRRAADLLLRVQVASLPAHPWLSRAFADDAGAR